MEVVCAGIVVHLLVCFYYIIIQNIGMIYVPKPCQKSLGRFRISHFRTVIHLKDHKTKQPNKELRCNLEGMSRKRHARQWRDVHKKSYAIGVNEIREMLAEHEDLYIHCSTKFLFSFLLPIYAVWEFTFLAFFCRKYFISRCIYIYWQNALRLVN